MDEFAFASTDISAKAAAIRIGNMIKHAWLRSIVSTYYVLQPRNFAYIRLLNKPYENEVTLSRQNLSLKCC